MAIENFEGKNIQDTFQRVVQTDGTNQLADGTGSIFIPVSSSHAITASHALFAVSASHEVTFELSSSHAVSADTASFATNFTSSGNISASGDLFVRNIRINDPNGGTTFEIDTSTGDGKIRFTDNGSVKWDLGRDNTQQNFVISNGSGLGADDLFILTTENNIQLSGSVTASGDISASGNLTVNSEIRGNTGLNLYPTEGSGNGRIQLGQSDTIFFSPPRPNTDISTKLGTATKRWSELNVQHITASGNISASGNLEISSSLTFGDGIAQIIGPGNNDYIQLATDNIDIFINGAEVINVDNDSINFNVSNQDIDFNYTSDNGIPLIFGDAANNRVKLRDFVTIGSGSTPNADSNALLVSGSSQFIGHITASGNISSSGHISSSGLYVESSTITDFIKLNSLGSSANPIKLIFEKSAAEQGIIEYNRNGDLELYNSDSDGGVMIDGSTSAGGDFYVANSGKVGIGTTSPGEQLEVVGNISASGTISASRFNGSGDDLTDVSYNNLSFVPSGIISGAAQINNLDLTINGGTF